MIMIFLVVLGITIERYCWVEVGVKKVSDARKSAGWALLFIAILYTTAPRRKDFRARKNYLFLQTFHLMQQQLLFYQKSNMGSSDKKRIIKSRN
jgi:Na+(H+)/acetate symporter ActP